MKYYKVSTEKDEALVKATDKLHAVYKAGKIIDYGTGSSVLAEEVVLGQEYSEEDFN